MSRARSGSDWAFRASSTSGGPNPGLSFWTHVSNCFSSGVRVLNELGGFWPADEEMRR